VTFRTRAGPAPADVCSGPAARSLNRAAAGGRFHGMDVSPDSAREQLAAAIAQADHEGTLGEWDLSPPALAASWDVPEATAADALQCLEEAGLGRGGSDALVILAAAGTARQLAGSLPAQAGGLRTAEEALLGTARRSAVGQLRATDRLMLRTAREVLAEAALIVAGGVSPGTAGHARGSSPDPVAVSWPGGLGGFRVAPVTRRILPGLPRAAGRIPPRPGQSRAGRPRPR
jgi:hypothetical protein